ncbi:MAG: site-specific integrase [Oscillospiraceae bacterium]|nr:site-specific integrase [Oscillospiraceae bacterium]
MASATKLRTTKDGRRYWIIQASRGRGQSPYSKRFYWPTKTSGEPYSEKRALEELEKAVSQFQKDVDAGLIKNNAEKKELREAEEKKAAEEKAKQAQLLTVRQYAEGVWMAGKELELAETTRSSYQMFLDKYVLPEIGNSLLKDVNASMLKKLLLDFQKSGMSLSSARTLHVVLRGLFDSAFKDGSIPISPMLWVDRPKKPKNAPAASEADQAFVEDELVYIMDCLSHEPLKWRAYINLAIDTGCRRGELTALKWSDINSNDETVTVERSLQYTPEKGVYIGTPKNGTERVIDIGAETVALLNALHDDQTERAKKRAEKTGKKVVHLSPWVFNQDGTDEPMHPDSPTRYFKKFGDKYGITGFHPHRIRHSSASIAIRNGVDVAAVSKRLGHSDINITLRTYVHATDRDVRAAGQTVRAALASKKAEQEKKVSGENNNAEGQ